MKKGNKIDISIIIVNYHVKNELFECIQSIQKMKPHSKYEVIVVDNDEIRTIQQELKSKFSSVIYIPNTNKGYGQGNNVGASKAKGKYLFILNPDTKIENNAIDQLINYLDNHTKVAIAAPLLLDQRNKPYKLQGSEKLTPIRAIYAFSFISKLFPQNKTLRKFWLDSWDKKQVKEVHTVPGTALVIRKDVFQSLGGFDDNFFLYFEETDLCKRVSDQGWRIVMLPQAKVYHAWGKSTDKSKRNIKKIFETSRYYYFKKHFGIAAALLTESVLRFNKYKLLLLGVLAFALYLATYRLHELMPFIGDQGWYYLAARDMLLNGTLPLVGIPSSHPWLHQGAFWTYILVPLLWISNFNPISGAYFSIALHMLTLLMLYFIFAKVFSERVALVSVLLYASSPLIIHHARMPYHTSPIPFLSLLLFYALYQWIKGRYIYFPVVICLLAILYNFEIAAFLLTIVVTSILIYGFWKRTSWYKNIFNKKIMLLSVAGFVIPMLPMLLYDLGHGFPQTFKFLTWIGYKILLLFGYPPINPPIDETSYKSVLAFLGESYKKLVYLPSSLVAFTLALFSFSFLVKSLNNQYKVHKVQVEFVLVTLITVISIIGIITTKTASEAYLPILFPFIVLILALFFESLLKQRPRTLPIVSVIILVMASANAYSLMNENYFINKGVQYSDMLNLTKTIVSEANGKRYNLVGQGGGSEHESFLMKYEYLAWREGNSPSKTSQPLQFIIEETPQGLIVKKQVRKL